MPALLWGVAFANIVPACRSTPTTQFTGTLFTLLNPYALLGGLTTLTLFLLHGAVFLALKTDGDDPRCARELMAARLSRPDRSSSPESSRCGRSWPTARAGPGLQWPWPPLALAGAVVATRAAREGLAFALTSVVIVAAVVLMFGSLFPNVMPSSTDPAGSLTIDNASSTPYTLTVMTWVAVLLTPLVLLYQGWTYWVFRQRISSSHVPSASGLSPSTRSV